MDVSVEDIRGNLKQLSDEELARIARGKADEYRQEAIAFANAELLARGVDIDRYGDLSTGRAQPVSSPELGQKARPAVRFPRWWFWGCLTAAIAVIFAMLRNSEAYSGKATVYMLTVAIDLIVLADLDLLFDWRNQKGYFRSRQGWQVIVALGITLWSFLCLFGAVKY